MIRFALLGCGQIAAKHISALKNHVPNAEVVAVCDPDEARASAMAALAGCPSFSSLDKMMAAMGDRVDVVSALTPTGYHLDSILQIARYKKHAVVEKPMALTTVDSQRMVEACRLAGTHLFVVKQNRFNRPIQKLREAVQEGRFGKIVLATVRVRWRRDQSYYDKDAWRGTRALDGGVLRIRQAIISICCCGWSGTSRTSPPTPRAGSRMSRSKTPPRESSASRTGRLASLKRRPQRGPRISKLR